MIGNVAIVMFQWANGPTFTGVYLADWLEGRTVPDLYRIYFAPIEDEL